MEAICLYSLLLLSSVVMWAPLQILPQVLNRCPPGTKAHVLCVGYLQADAGFFLRGGNTSTYSNPDGPGKHERRDLVMYVVLIDHPSEGLILYETGCGYDYPNVWPSAVHDVFHRSKYLPEHELDTAIAKVGYNIKDVKMVIIGHLHLDHEFNFPVSDGSHLTD